ncbi:uncharacterized protein L969DRAFT_493984 [Mixia osmundae IAM 14324]|uniref:Acyl-CoA thioesterase II domain-containing protein n=1 Tax=Mixia osmundae (strain CBS 9802 / IAM 14324 / JCM 22182 / KY 12970) TaxID=764103 RepID=G7E102_MIXOS|nr:uncharacterized protein L969DRAFT_493984 [Mixia osmundae IAM 14324]KEI38853.1 hypothetical protein L969DRAFT_493984 [Mixia osmundae IAM 14324]GAA96512.1 hypothetical protein E5Q_03180 [Mixia osmundae IAM 14324]
MSLLGRAKALLPSGKNIQALAPSPDVSATTSTLPAVDSEPASLTPQRRGNGRADLIEYPVELEKVGDDLYRSCRLFKPSVGPGTYGGQVLAQAAWAATQTVPPELSMHSLHSYFLHPSDPNVPLVYRVERIRDGRSYATRLTTANQKNKVVFTITCSFSRPEPIQTLDYAPPMPIPELKPDNCISAEDKLQNFFDKIGKKLPKEQREQLRNGIRERKRMPVEVRNAQANDADMLMADGENNQAFWLRPRGRVRNDLAFAKIVLLYMSDLGISFTVSKALGLDKMSDPPLGTMVSLDHSVHFYFDDWDPSGWTFFHLTCPVAGDGRGIAEGQMWTEDGKLLAIVTQEAVCRADNRAELRAQKQKEASDAQSPSAKL